MNVEDTFKLFDRIITSDDPEVKKLFLQLATLTLMLDPSERYETDRVFGPILAEVKQLSKRVKNLEEDARKERARSIYHSRHSRHDEEHIAAMKALMDLQQQKAVQAATTWPITMAKKYDIGDIY